MSDTATWESLNTAVFNCGQFETMDVGMPGPSREAGICIWLTKEILASGPRRDVLVAREITANDVVHFGQLDIRTESVDLVTVVNSFWNEAAATLAESMKHIILIEMKTHRSQESDTSQLNAWTQGVNSYIAQAYDSVREDAGSRMAVNDPSSQNAGSVGLAGLISKLLDETADRYHHLRPADDLTLEAAEGESAIALGVSLEVSAAAREKVGAEGLDEAVRVMEDAIHSAFGPRVSAELSYRKDPEIPDRERFVLTIAPGCGVEETLTRENNLKRMLRATLKPDLLRRLCFVQRF